MSYTKGINGRAKGSAGEREFCQWLYDTFKLDKIPERNLEQTREGGADVLGMPPFIFEVKRQEKLDLDTWWLQVLSAVRELNIEVVEIDVTHIPVVAFRQNNQKWEFLISAKHIGLRHGFVRLQSLRFVQWAKAELLDSD